MRNHIPTGWSEIQLGRAAKLQRGFDLPVQMREPGTFPVYGSNGVDGWHSLAVVRGPGVITGRSGSIGFVFYEERDFWPLNTTLYVRDFFGNDEKFIARLLESLNLKSFAASTGVPSLNRNFVHPIPVLIPPLPEQRSIAALLNTVDDAIRRTEEVIEKLKRIKAGLLHDLLTQGLDKNGELRDPIRHPEQFKESPLGRIPREWDVLPAESFCVSVTDGTHDTPKPAHKGKPLITSKNLKDGFLDFDDAYLISESDYKAVRARSWVEPGDILFGMIGTIGNPVIVQSGQHEIAPKNVGLFRFGGDFIISQYMKAVLSSHLIERQLLDVLAGSTQKFVGLGLLRKLKTPIPPKEQIKRISDILSHSDESIQSEFKVLVKMRSLKQGLMQDLLTGKVRVKLDRPAESAQS